MRATGVVRRVDDLGRIVIPREIRNKLHIEDGQPMELYIEDDSVIFKKVEYAENVSAVIRKAISYIGDEDELSFKFRNELIAKMKEALSLIEKKGAD